MPTYTAPTTRTTGELISAAIFNTDLVENLKYFKDAPAFAGNVTVGGTLGVTSTVTGGTYNGQTISSAANFTGTLGVAGLLTVSGNIVPSVDNTYNLGVTTKLWDKVFTNNVVSDVSAGLSIQTSHASGAIRFYSGGATLRGTLTAGGNLVLGTNAAANLLANGASGFGIYSSYQIQMSAISDVAAYFQRTTTTGVILSFYYNGVSRGTITTDGTGVTLTTASDQRLKTDLGIAQDLSSLRAITIHDFAWKADGSRDRGVFAQDAYAFYPRAISVGDDTLKDGQLANPWQAAYSKFVPDLIVGWQQHDTLIDQLAARIAALETKDN